MSTQTKWLRLFLILVIGVISNVSQANEAPESVTLYTPFTKISLAPGESIEYAIDVINNSKEVQNADISVAGMPAGWNHSIKSGGYTISQISILPGERKSISLKVEIPLGVNKGNYKFNVNANGMTSLPLVINISQQGSLKSEFTTTQSNMQGNVNTPFTFSANIKNRSTDKQHYAFVANAPRGWTVTFKANYQPVTAVDVDANNTTPISIEIKAPEKTEAGKYKIPVRAESGSSFSDLDLEVVITGSFSIEMTTPTGLVSADLTAGESKQIELVISNNGSSNLSDIKPEAAAPVSWSVTFDPKKVDLLRPGKTARVYATIKADKKAIPGDYVTNIEAKTPEVSSKLSFRISVETPMLWGWLGVLITLVALGSVYYLFRKYGRR